jgi:hypothetical protein
VVEPVESKGMRLRISELRTPDGTRIQVDGELVGDGVEELEAVTSRRMGLTTLDLKGLTQIRQRGTTLLRELAREGVVLEGVSPYFGLLIEGPTSPRRN